MRRPVLIADVSGKYAQLTARAVREREIYCEVVRPAALPDEIKNKRPAGIILTGSFGDEKLISDELIIELSRAEVPVLAIGAGAAVQKTIPSSISAALAPDLLCGEVDTVFKDFLFGRCGCAADWTALNFAEETISRLKRELGESKVICAFSGGVDSTVAAVMVHKAIGDNLICIFVDHGMMRKNEGDSIMETLKNTFDMKVIRVDASGRFLTKLKGVTDPETKRKIIGAEFIEVFSEYAANHDDAKYLLQGTIYPDVLESGLDGADNVKSHHNVGGLPEKMSLELVEPLRILFKDEVRRVGAALGIPESIINRQPFPGPGLGVRCLGELTKQRLDILRECDAIVREELEKSGLAKDIWQYFAVLTNVSSVGMKDGRRTYGEIAAIRAVRSIDAMTAEYVKIPYDILDRITERITVEVEQISRVVLDITGKPPSTIEWE